MSKERILLGMLAAIFTYQAGVFAYGLYTCSNVTPHTAISKICPDIGRRYDETFTLMITSVLALLTGNSIRNDV